MNYLHYRACWLGLAAPLGSVNGMLSRAKFGLAGLCPPLLGNHPQDASHFILLRPP